MPEPVAAPVTTEPGTGAPATTEPPAGTAEPLRPYMGQMKAEYKTNQEIGKHETINDFAKAYLDLKGKEGKPPEGYVKVPDAKSPQEEKDAYSKARGVPKEPAGYVLDKPSDIPEGFNIKEERVNLIKELAHKLDLTPKQANGVYIALNSVMIGDFRDHQNAIQAAIDKSNEQLKKEWGDDFEKFDGYAKSAVQTFGTEEAMTMLDTIEVNGEKIGNNPFLRRMFAAIGKAMIEDELLKGEGPGKGGPIEATGQMVYKRSPELHQKK